MFSKYVFTDRLSKPHRVYILMGITSPLAISAFVLALLAGDLIHAGLFGFVSLVWSVRGLYFARRFFRHGEIHVSGETRRYRHRTFRKTLFLFVLLASIAALVVAILFGSPLYFVLTDLWGIIMSGSEFIFVSVLTQ